MVTEELNQENRNSFTDLENKVFLLESQLHKISKENSLSTDAVLKYLQENRFVKSDIDLRAFSNHGLDYKGTFVKEDLVIEVYGDCHYTKDIVPFTEEFARINFRNLNGTFLRYNCFCGIGEEEN